MCKIGIMGGTFNPIHKGHIQIAQSAYEQYHLDEVWFMPNHIPAYKDNTEIVSGIDRYHMVEMAIEPYAYFKASDFELKQDGATYTCNTLTLLKKAYPQHEFYFIMGADSLIHFLQWKDPGQLVNLATFLVAARDDVSKSLIVDRMHAIQHEFNHAVFYVVDCPIIRCSSSEIRKKLMQSAVEKQESIMSYLNTYLDEDVLAYIRQKQLYI